MAMNRHLTLLEARIDRLQTLLRRKGCPEIGYSCLQNIVAEGDGWSDWEDFLDHGRYAAIERHWQERTLKALQRMGIEEISADDLRHLEQESYVSAPPPRAAGQRESNL